MSDESNKIIYLDVSVQVTRCLQMLFAEFREH